MHKLIFLAAVLVLLAGCAPTRTMTRTTNTAFDRQGHRGSRGLLPENTIPAMRRALELGVTTLELDVVLTRDGKVVLSHEPFFSHLISTHPDGRPVTEAEEKTLNIYAMTWDEVRRFDVGLRPHPSFPRQQKLAVHKPLLRTVIDSADAYAKALNRPLPFYNIEIKSGVAGDEVYHPAPPAFSEAVVAMLKEKDLMARANIQSFDFRPLQYLHRQYPDLRLAVLIEASDKRDLDRQLSDLGFTPWAYSPHYSRVNEALVAVCRQKGMKLIPWTVNQRDAIETLQKLGVDGIITDYPDLFD